MAAAAALALAGAPPVAAEGGAGETIVLRLRHSYIVCAGFCPHFEMTVGPDRRVVSRALYGDGIYRYRVRKRQYRNFRQILGSVRPSGYRRLDGHCPKSLLPDGRPDDNDDPLPNDVEVRWITAGRESRLTSCGYTHVRTRRAIERAVRALGAELLSGRPAGNDY